MASCPPSLLKENNMEIIAIMENEKYASVEQLMHLAKQKMYNKILFLLKHYNYCRYTISIHSKSLMNAQTPNEIRGIIMEYEDSVNETL